MTGTKAAQARTKVVHVRDHTHDVYIGRPSMWGNPYVIGPDGTRSQVIKKYRAWFHSMLEHPEFKQKVELLRGRTLGCYCKPLSCHGDVIVEYLEGPRKLW